MSELNKKKTALEVYQYGYGLMLTKEGILDSKRFFLELRDSIIRELETDGECSLIDYIEQTEKIDCLIYAVFRDIANGYENNELSSLTRDPHFLNYIPRIRINNGWRIPWDEYQSYDISVQKAWPTIQKAKKAVLARRAEKEAESPNKSALKQAEGEEMKKQILKEAEEEAEAIREKARKEAETIKNEAYKEAEEIRREARRHAQELTDDARNKAEEKENEISKERAEKLVNEYLAREQKEYKTELNQEMQAIVMTNLENTKRAKTVHQQMCDKTSEIQIQWIRALENAIGQMTELKEDYYSHLHEWQTSLFPNEIKPICERYLELYRIINVDKLLREEILASNKEDEPAVNPRIAGLQKLNRTLTTFLRRFEMALNGLDLYVFYPQAGEKFDELKHILNDEDDEAEGTTIKECVTPGIAKRANDHQGDDVVIPAVVILEQENE